MKTTYKYLLLILLLLIVFFLGWCSKPNSTVITEGSTKELKKDISLLNQKKEKLKDSIVYKESVRFKHIVKWKEVRHDSLIPCPEKLALADTVIRQDSSLISSLKTLCVIDSSIISNQYKIIKIDSTNIVGLKKDVRRRFWKGFKMGFVVGNVTGVVTVLSISK